MAPWIIISISLAVVFLGCALAILSGIKKDKK
jgi:hypothetical protein